MIDGLAPAPSMIECVINYDKSNTDNGGNVARKRCKNYCQLLVIKTPFFPLLLRVHTNKIRISCKFRSCERIVIITL